MAMRNTNRLRFYCSVIFCCLSFFFVEAQREVMPAEQLTIADNLTAQTYNYFTFKDSEGFVWISSLTGLNRYDGQEIIQYHPDDSDPYAISDVAIYGRFFEDKYSNLWFGTRGAIHCYDRLNDRFIKYQIKTKEEEPDGYRLLSINEEKKSLLVLAMWSEKQDQLYDFSVDAPEDFNYVLKRRFALNTAVVESKRAGSKTLYIPLSDAGLNQIVIKEKKGKFEIVSDTVLLSDKRIEALFYEDEEHVWCVGPEGLLRANANGEIYEINNAYMDVDLQTMVSVSPYSANQLLIGTRSEGLFLADKATVEVTDQMYYSKDGKVQMFNSSIDLVNVDNDGTTWVSTNGQGVFYLTPGHKKLNAYLHSYNGEFFGRSNVQSIVEDQDGLLWCLTKRGIVVVDSLGNTLPEYNYLTNDLPAFLEDYVYSIFCDQHNQIFVCSENGLHKLHKGKKTFQPIKMANDSLSKGIVSGMLCQNKRVLVSGLMILSGDSLANFCKLIDKGKDLRLEPISCEASTVGITMMFEGSAGGIYLCRDGVGILIGNESNGQFLVDTFISEKLVVHGLVEDVANQIIWVAAKTGLFRLEKKGNTYSLNKSETINLTNLNGILLDDSTGYLWVSNNNGLHAFHPDSSTCRTFTLKEGLQSQEFNFWSALKTSTGLFAFGGTNGINLFDPQKALKRKAKIPVPKITGIRIDEVSDTSLVCDNTGAKNISQFESLKLRFSKNTIAFNFAALDYLDPNANKFKFQMEGVDDDWVYSGNNNSARYPNLPIGTYLFKVKASSAEGVWSTKNEYITKLKIEILAPWYRTWGAYITYVFATIFFAYRFYKSRINRIRKEEEFKRKEAEFKQKEAEYKQLAAETETAVLRLQMNPHFIFNSMNSISSYILERDVGTANTYLDRFAKLMRMILKLGKQPFIPIADEIDLLDQYMKTEAMRFEQKFGYDFDLDPNINEDDDFVPTMILQPFVENAIWHGLSGKTGKGHIQIRFWKDANSLYCSIEDNGIGREAAKKKKKLTAHKSQALEITRRRLALLGEKEGKKADFTFEDVLDERENIAGTRVLLQIPLL